MSRLTLLVLILAIGLAVYVALNPPARERAEAAWEDARATIVEFYARISPDISNLFSRNEDDSGAAEASAPNRDGAAAASETESQSSMDTAPLIDFSAILDSVQQVWLSFTSRLKLEAS